MQRVTHQGYVTYALDNNTANYPGFRQQAADVAQAGNDYIGIPAYEVWSKPDIWLTMPTDAEFLRVCGKDAAGCILYWTDPVIVYFRRALFYGDWRSAIAHEGINYGHAMGQHERYWDSGGRIECNRDPKPPTVMSCGTGIWHPQAFDRNVVWNFFVPDRPNQLFLTVENGWGTVHWNQTRRDGGAAHHGNSALDNVTRVAFGWSENPASPVYWVGDECGPAFNYCYAAPGEGQRGFDAYWSGCLWLRMESNVLWWVGQVSAPHYWSLAGCFGIGGYDEFTHAAVEHFGTLAGDATCIGWYESLFIPTAEGPFLERGVLQVHPIHFDYGRRSFMGYTWDDMFYTWPNLDVARRLFDDSMLIYGDGWRPWATKGLCFG